MRLSVTGSLVNGTVIFGKQKMTEGEKNTTHSVDNIQCFALIMIGRAGLAPAVNKHRIAVGTGLAPVLICCISHCGQPQGQSLRYGINYNLCTIQAPSSVGAYVCKCGLKHRTKLVATIKIIFHIIS